MASIIQAGPAPYPHPSFQNGAASPVNNNRPPLNTGNSFESHVNGNATPTPTRPTSQSQHQLMPYNVGSFGSNGIASQQSTPRAQPEMSNGAPIYLPGQQPQIYTVSRAETHLAALIDPHRPYIQMFRYTKWKSWALQSCEGGQTLG